MFLLLQTNELFSQKDSLDFVYDTFFLAKKKGLLGRLGKNFAADPPKPELTKTGTIKNNLPFNRYKGHTIRNIYFIRLEFNQGINDTTRKKRNIGYRILDAFHTTSREKILRSNLFFKEGDKLNPYLLADNERHFREQSFLQDAKITLDPVDFDNAVDVYVYTKDVFSLGVNGNISGTNNFDAEIKEENLEGNGTKLSFKTLYDETRGPNMGFGGEFLQRNVAGSFTDFSIGFKNFNGAFSSGRPEETFIYARLQRPLVSPYLSFTGNIELEYHNTSNAYIIDSIFNQQFNYKYIDFDAWGGYNLGTKKLLKLNIQNRIRKFIALRLLHHQFQTVPGIFQNTYNYQYANITGALGELNLFKQNFYKTTYIYGFGRQEDVPEGFNLGLIGGWVNKQDKRRPYYGFDFTRNYFGKKGNYYNYTFKLGGYVNESQFEDVDVLLNLEYFSKLKRIGRKWYLRNFTTWGITHQIKPILNQPLYLSNSFGLPEISNGNIAAKTRVTAKYETVFYNNWRLFGFKFAPFFFTNASFLIPQKEPVNKGDFYSSLGGGIRTRNEALTLGTIECRFNYFPRINEGMLQYRIDFKTDLRFKYNSQYIRRPEFVTVN